MGAPKDVGCKGNCGCRKFGNTGKEYMGINYENAKVMTIYKRKSMLYKVM